MRSVGNLIWLPDQSGLFLTATSTTAGRQIWFVAYPSGKTQRVTNDFSTYGDLSLTADASALVATQITEASNIWVAPANDLSQARALTSGSANYNSVNWFPDGRLITAVNLTDRAEFWRLEADGSGLRQITYETGGKYHPTVSSDGRYIVFESGRSGRMNLWRVKADGTGLIQLTDLATVHNPQCSPDGKWVLFSSRASEGPWSIWRVPIEGGQAEQFIEGLTGEAIISPDGQSIAYVVPEPETKLIVRPFAGGAPSKTFLLPSINFRSLVWAPDGKGFTFCNSRADNSEIYYLPLAGGEPQKLTNFRSQTIYSMAWSPDGKRLAFTRGQKTSDVVSITNFK
jgi:Tol biopolymer transport system component